MPIFSDLLERRGITVAKEFLRPGVGRQTFSGVSVSHESALMYSAVFRAVDLISKHVAMLPFVLFERTGERSKVRAEGHPVYNLLRLAPNPMMTAYNYRVALMAHVLLWGNHYSEIVWGRDGYPRELWPLRPDRMEMRRDRNGELFYRYRYGDGGSSDLRPYQVLHIRGLNLDGEKGLSVIGHARQTIGLGLAAEQFGAEFFGNGARPGGVLEYPGVLGDEGFDALQESWLAAHQGLGNSNRVAILEEGVTYKQIGIPPEDAQFLETRKFQVTDIARFFGVQPHKLMDLGHATFSNIEHQSIEYVQDALQPWAVNLEQSVDLQLLLPSERGRFYSKLLLAALLRGDSQARTESYASGIQNGYYSINDVRALEDMDPVAGGDAHLVQMNLGPLDAIGGGATMPKAVGGSRAAPAKREAARLVDAAEMRSASQRRRVRESYLRVLADALGRVFRREANDVGNKARSMLGDGAVADFETWLAEFYREHEGFIGRQMFDVVLVFAELIADVAWDEVGTTPDRNRLERFINGYVRSLATRLAATSEGRLRRLLDELGAEALDAIETELESWRETRPQQVARGEVVRADGAVAVMVYGLAGRGKRWVSFGDNCPYCNDLDGTVMADAGQPFLSSGTEYQPDGAEAPLVVGRDVGHAPAHDGCDCMVVSA